MDGAEVFRRIREGLILFCVGVIGIPIAVFAAILVSRIVETMMGWQLP